MKFKSDVVILRETYIQPREVTKIDLSSNRICVSREIYISGTYAQALLYSYNYLVRLIKVLHTAEVESGILVKEYWSQWWWSYTRVETSWTHLEVEASADLANTSFFFRMIQRTW